MEVRGEAPYRTIDRSLRVVWPIPRGGRGADTGFAAAAPGAFVSDQANFHPAAWSRPSTHVTPAFFLHVWALERIFCPSPGKREVGGSRRNAPSNSDDKTLPARQGKGIYNQSSQ